MKKLFLFLFLFLSLAAIAKPQIARLLWPTTAYAVGDLTVNWGVPTGNPIFSLHNMAPGDVETHTVVVSNGAASARPVGIKGLLTSETGSMSSALSIVISQNGTQIYGPKTLQQFFTDSGGLDGMKLSVLGPASSTSYVFTVTFTPTSGNEFQGKQVVFDLQIGISVPIPTACKNMKITGKTIFGTQGNDVINGTSGNDLIIAFDGNNTIYGNSGNDCIIAGNGNNTIHGGSGDDVIVVGNGTNHIYGDSGNDVLIGGNGNTTADGGSGKNSCHAKTEIQCQIKL